MLRRPPVFAAAILALGLALAPAWAGDEAAAFPPDDVAVVRVVGPAGEPVAGATVELLAEPAVVSAEEPPAVAATGVTKEDGRTRLDVIPFGRYLLPWVPKGPVRIVAEAGEERSRTVELDLAADRRVDLELPVR